METEGTEEEPQAITPVTFESLFQRQKTGLTQTIEDVALRSSTSMSVNDTGKAVEVGESSKIVKKSFKIRKIKKGKEKEKEEAYKISKIYIESDEEKNKDKDEDEFEVKDIKGKGKAVDYDNSISKRKGKEIVESKYKVYKESKEYKEEEVKLPICSERELLIGFEE